jgi:hypothetical protein
MGIVGSGKNYVTTAFITRKTYSSVGIVKAIKCGRLRQEIHKAMEGMGNAYNILDENSEGDKTVRIG